MAALGSPPSLSQYWEYNFPEEKSGHFVHFAILRIDALIFCCTCFCHRLLGAGGPRRPGQRLPFLLPLPLANQAHAGNSFHTQIWT